MLKFLLIFVMLLQSPQVNFSESQFLVREEKDAPSDREISSFLDDFITQSIALVKRLVAFVWHLFTGKIFPFNEPNQPQQFQRY